MTGARSPHGRQHGPVAIGFVERFFLSTDHWLILGHQDTQVYLCGLLKCMCITSACVFKSRVMTQPESATCASEVGRPTCVGVPQWLISLSCPTDRIRPSHRVHSGSVWISWLPLAGRPDRRYINVRKEAMLRPQSRVTLSSSCKLEPG